MKESSDTGFWVIFDEDNQGTPVVLSFKEEPIDDQGATCCICGEPFSKEEWEDRHDFHDEGCPSGSSDTDGEFDCECDNTSHAACCPVCNDEEEE